MNIKSATPCCRTCDSLVSYQKKVENIKNQKSKISESVCVKTDIFHLMKQIFFTRKNSKLLTFYIEMAFKRIFSENIPLLYISKRNTHEKYMFLGGFQVVFPMKNITSGFWKISNYAWKIYVLRTFLMKMRGRSEKMSIEWENNEVFLLIIAFKGENEQIRGGKGGGNRNKRNQYEKKYEVFAS